MQTLITGSGIGLPRNIVPNEKLALIMDTSDEWIQTRSGIKQRYFVDAGQGSAELGVMAAERALEAAGVKKEEIDAVIFATMTPDYLFPGNGPILQKKLGLPEIPTFDIRQQCSGFLYGLDLADSLIRSEKYKKILLVGADVHTPFMPWNHGWDVTIGKETREVTPEEKEINTRSRDRTVLFGDGAGAVVLERSDDEERGFLALKLFTDGGSLQALYVKGAGFRQRPFVSHEQIESFDYIPTMEGREVFKQAVSRMPSAVRKVCEEAGVKLEEIDLLLVHQANLRIVEAIGKSLGLPPDKVPHNIERYGNTTAGTLPILFHECREQGLIKQGSLVAFTALGSGLHWGAALYRA